MALKKTGAFSIVVSCHYKDDKDFGDTIYYTGTGGRKRWSDGCPPKRLRLGPQVFDQQWSDQGNEALVKSRDTGNAVRVIRSHKVLSDFAPAKGYRYDGLYTVESAWKEKNSKGLDICRYRLERVPGQPPLLRRSLGDTDHGPSPASVATSDTVISPSCMLNSRKRKAQPLAPQGDPTIYSDAASKKRKLADRAPPQPLLSSSAVQPQVLVPVLGTIETPLQKHNQRVQKEMQKEKQQHFPGTSSSVKTPATLVKPSMLSSQSQHNDFLARPMWSISCDEDDEDVDMPLDDEDEDDILLEDLETTAFPFSSFLPPSPF
ncbi:PUA-like domain-containing protein [Suillus subalutaceus]|uniref:PUA-like domain-containing protein n=1 Tax=Suillus subalutaceus TaxID=48586 RepID=UPI001B85D9A6|nr:PUA-like domain-containing protein [Suillus subalutaceus]KAG1851589.1 PUA-like domain-containing protein [Suillus subalutaceus]